MIRVMIKESSKPQGAINESELGVSPELLVKGNTSGFKKFLKGITKFGTIPAIAVELLPARELYMNCRAAGAERSICTEMFWKRFGSQGFVEFEEELGKMRMDYRKAWNLYASTKGKVGKKGYYPFFYEYCDLDTAEDVRKEKCKNRKKLWDMAIYTNEHKAIVARSKAWQRRRYANVLAVPVKKLLEPNCPPGYKITPAIDGGGRRCEPERI
jgi:hypothetical protein|tara:strand:+ start:4340 stop:4978 length:639 start_codon:yes stop_codon:yes gene_type:complete